MDYLDNILTVNRFLMDYQAVNSEKVALLKFAKKNYNNIFIKNGKENSGH